MKNPGMLAKKIASGFNYKYGSHIVINVSEFYGTSREKGSHLVRVYTIRDAYYGADGECENRELYKSGSAYNALFFMRDLLLRAKGEELPDNNARYVADRDRKNALAEMDYIVEKYVMKGMIVDEC